MGHVRFAVAGGHRLEYRWIAGDRTKGRPVLVFLHQGLGCVSMWRDAPAQLASRTGCPVLVYSRYGYGRSDVVGEPRPTDFMWIEGRDVLPDLLESLGVHDVILVGHSDGGTAALAYLASGHPARAAVVVAPHVFDEEITWRSIARQREAWGKDPLRGRLARYHADVDRMFQSWAEVWLRPDMRGWNMEPSLRAIRCPILAIQGVDDAHGSMAQIDAIARAAGGPVQLEKLAGCGHDPFREQPETVLALCAAFVDRFSAPGAAPQSVPGSAPTHAEGTS